MKSEELKTRLYRLENNVYELFDALTKEKSTVSFISGVSLSDSKERDKAIYELFEHDTIDQLPHLLFQDGMSGELSFRYVYGVTGDVLHTVGDTSDGQEERSLIDIYSTDDRVRLLYLLERATEKGVASPA